MWVAPSPTYISLVSVQNPTSPDIKIGRFTFRPRLICIVWDKTIHLPLNLLKPKSSEVGVVGGVVPLYTLGIAFIRVSRFPAISPLKISWIVANHVVKSDWNCASVVAISTRYKPD